MKSAIASRKYFAKEQDRQKNSLNLQLIIQTWISVSKSSGFLLFLVVFQKAGVAVATIAFWLKDVTFGRRKYFQKIFEMINSFLSF